MCRLVRCCVKLVVGLLVCSSLIILKKKGGCEWLSM